MIVGPLWIVLISSDYAFLDREWNLFTEGWGEIYRFWFADYGSSNCFLFSLIADY